MKFTTKSILASSFLLACPGLEASDQWNMFQANPAHTGYIPVTINPADVTFRWSKDVGSSLSPVTAGEGKIYFSKPGYFGIQNLYAIHKSGEFAWGKSYSDVFGVNPPSYSDGKVYVQIGAGTSSSGPVLSAFQASTGNFVFQSPFDAQFESYDSPTVYDGHVYINGGSYGGMYSFGGTHGLQKWFYGGLPQVDGWTPAVDEKWAYCALEGKLYVLERLTGKLVFKISGASGSNPVPMLGIDNDVFIIDGGMLTKFDTLSRRIAWQKVFGINENYVGQPALAKGVVYAGTSQGRLVALSEGTGKVIWSAKVAANDSIKNNIIITDSHAFLGNSTNVFAVDLKTQRNAWTYAASGFLALAESRLYIANAKGKLTAIQLGIPDLYAPGSASFGTLAPLGQATKKIRLTNVGDMALNIAQVDSDSPAFQLLPLASAVTLSPGASWPVSVTFSPSEIGLFEGNLRIHSDDPNEPELIVSLKGEGK